MEEILEATASSTGGKAPGPDAIPVEIYKIFKNKLFQPFKKKNV